MKLELQPTKKVISFGGQELTIETGAVARQADGAVLVRMGDSIVLVTVVAAKGDAEDKGFLPLTVNYQVKTYAGGKIPGGFLKREGRPSEDETLTSRLMDRPIRPLFPKGFANEVQVIATVLSSDPQHQTDVLAMIGASAALAISGIPFAGPLGAARVGYKNGEYLLNPSYEVLVESDLELMVAGTEQAVLMVESEARELSEAVMLGAVLYGHQQMQPVIQAIAELASAVGKPRWDWSPAPTNDAFMQQVAGAVGSKIAEAYTITDKTERQAQLKVLRKAVVDQLCTGDEHAPAQSLVEEMVATLEKAHVREAILQHKPRIDGRDTKTVRPIHIALSPLPRAHGSAIFTRGETQALVTVTLGTDRDAQLLDPLHGEERDSFMLHYNFPPYSVGEVGFMGSPKRREIGHGNLAKRAIKAVLPNTEDFPYVLRVVSEITESNGSSSMATVCGTSLALMDAGVAISSPVAGIAMGLIKEEGGYAILTDILGDEDHLGDMDFKVAGTLLGITALQMDIKIDGLTKEIMEAALEQAKAGRMHILDVMKDSISGAREVLSDYAPRFFTMKIHPDKIRDVIGKGGVTIRNITETTGVTIDLDDDGTVKIASSDNDAAQAALNMIKDITAEAELGAVYDGKVLKIMEFGAFIDIPGSKDGFLHISEIRNERVFDINDVLSEGQVVKVKVIEIDRQKRIRVSMKVLEEAVTD